MDQTSSFMMLPTQASTIAPGYDLLFWVITFMCVFFFVLIIGAGTYFVIKYRYRGGEHQVATDHTHNTAMEIAWSVIPLVLTMGLFAWGFKLYLEFQMAPKDAIEIRVTGQKWVWNFEYDNGAVSSKEFAAPLNKPVKLIMTSRDVLHSFFVPNFRTKMDVVPGRYTTLWFQATQAGDHQVFCTEYCGTSHSDMLAKVHVLPEKEYVDWVEKHRDDPNATPSDRGKKIFAGKGGCVACHAIAADQQMPNIGPKLWQVFGRVEKMVDGAQVTVDDNYVRESIEYPNKQTVAGFAAGAMPTFKGVLSDQEISDLIAYLKSLK